MNKKKFLIGLGAAGLCAQFACATENMPGPTGPKYGEPGFNLELEVERAGFVCGANAKRQYSIMTDIGEDIFKIPMRPYIRPSQSDDVIDLICECAEEGGERVGITKEVREKEGIDCRSEFKVEGNYIIVPQRVRFGPEGRIESKPRFPKPQ